MYNVHDYSVLGSKDIHWYYVRVVILLTCEKHLHGLNI